MAGAGLGDRSEAEFGTDTVTTGIGIDDHVFDPRLEAGRNSVEREREAAEDPAVDAGEEQHRVDTRHESLEISGGRRRGRRRQLRDQPLEGLDQFVVDSLGTLDVDGRRWIMRGLAHDPLTLVPCTGSVFAVGTEHVRWLAQPNLNRPVLVAAFTGWNDAGDAASSALRTMVESWGAQPLAEIDPEPFTDFATVRPSVRLDEDHHRSIVWPTVGVWSASLPGTDVILVLGPEPALRWRLFCEQIGGIADHFGVNMAISLGALLADVPHSRPVPLIGTATDDQLIERFELRRSQYEGPTGIVGVLHDHLNRVGMATASLWAAVPGYASQIPSPKAALALVERACSMIGTPAPLARLAVEASEYDARVAAMIGDDDDMIEYLTRLEQLTDDDTDDHDDMATDSPVDPDALVEEVEQFLRDRDTD